MVRLMGKKMDPVDVGRVQIPTKGQPNPAFAYEMGALSLVKEENRYSRRFPKVHLVGEEPGGSSPFFHLGQFTRDVDSQALTSFPL